MARRIHARGRFWKISVQFSLCVVLTTADTGALTIPRIAGDLASVDQLHDALEPAWKSLVEDRNSAGLVGPKEEGRPQPPLSKEETAFQFERVQRGEVDSARLLLVFGMVPSATHLDNGTLELLMDERAREEESGEVSDSGNLPAVFEPGLRYADGSTPLHAAATFGLVGSIRTLLDSRADIHATTKSGVQPIHAAAIMGHADAIDLLVQRKSDVGARHAFAGSTPLHFAAEMGHPAVVRRLCHLGADVAAEKRHGGTALHVAADTNNSAVARALLEEPCGADPEAVLLGDTVPLYLAAGRGFGQVIDVLLEGGANPDRTLWPQRPVGKQKSKKNKGRATAGPLSTAQANPAHLLPGSDPNAPGWEAGNGATALHNACENGHMEAVSALLDGGARQLSTMQGVTPLITALQYRQPDIASVLLDHRMPAGVAVASPADGQTALHIAAAYDYPEVVARILREGGSVAARDRGGRTPLDYGRGELTRWLLLRFNGRDPRLDAAVMSHPDVGLEAQAALAAVEEVSAKTKKQYLRYAQRHAAGSLKAEVARLSRVLSAGELPAAKQDSLAQRLAVAGCVLAGNTYIAADAMLMKTERAMHAGLALLGMRVRGIKYRPKQVLQVNGWDLLTPVNRALSTLQQSGDAAAFQRSIRELARKTKGPPSTISMGRGGEGLEL